MKKNFKKSDLDEIGEYMGKTGTTTEDIMQIPSSADVEGLPDNVSVMITEGTLRGSCFSVRMIREMDKAAKKYIKNMK
jgi:hypothetical protein